MIWFVLVVVLLFVAGGIFYFFVRDRSNVYERAMNFASNGNYMDARALIRSRIDRDPENARAHYQMSRIYHMEKDYERELVHLLEIKRINQYGMEVSQPVVLNRIAEIYYNQGQYKQSFEHYLDSVNTSSKNEEALAHLAFMAIGAGEFEIAERYFKDLVALSPGVSEYRVARGVGLAMMKKTDALKELQAGLELNPADSTARFLTALQAYRQKEGQMAVDLLDALIPNLNDTGILYIAHRLATASHYLSKSYRKAQEHAEKCLEISLNEGWRREEYDSRLALSYMAIYNGDLEKANDNLLELELQNPADEKVIQVSDFRMDLEEGITTLEQVSPRGFDFRLHMKDWLRDRFPDDTIYKISGLRMEEEVDIIGFFSRDGSRKKMSARPEIDYYELIDRFNSLPGPDFMSVSEKIMDTQGYKLEKILPSREKEGADFIARELMDRKNKALFRLRRWKDQPISDIFLRDMQNSMNELKVSRGYVIAGARLTPGAESALQNLKKITVINDQDLGELLSKVL